MPQNSLDIIKAFLADGRITAEYLADVISSILPNLDGVMIYENCLEYIDQNESILEESLISFIRFLAKER